MAKVTAAPEHRRRNRWDIESDLRVYRLRRGITIDVLSFVSRFSRRRISTIENAPERARIGELAALFAAVDKAANLLSAGEVAKVDARP